MSGDSRVSDVANELKLKSFEVERLQLVHEETVKNLKESQLDVERLQKKTEVRDMNIQETVSSSQLTFSKPHLLVNDNVNHGLSVGE